MPSSINEMSSARDALHGQKKRKRSSVSVESSSRSTQTQIHPQSSPKLEVTENIESSSEADDTSVDGAFLSSEDESEDDESLRKDELYPNMPPPALNSSKKDSQARANRAQDDGSAVFAGGLFKSNMFKLQVDEMLAEVQPNYEKRLKGVDDALRKLKGLIEGVKDHDELSIPEASKFLQRSYKITAPFPDPKPDANAAYKLAYATPANVNVVGSYPLRTMVKDDHVLSVDLVVVMPASIFQPKDYLNYRYFYKKAHYLACVAGGLQIALQEEYSLKFDYLHGNSLQPVLILNHKANREKPTSISEIRVIPAAPKEFFSESRLRPTKNCIRPAEKSEKDPLPATPFYNATLRADCNFESYLGLLHSSSKQSGGYRDACILGRLWLQQRGFGSSISKGGFGPFEWAALMAILLLGGSPKGRSVLSPGYSSYQLFKATIQFISANDLSKKPLSFESSDFEAPPSDCPTLYDGPRGQNLLYKMSPWSYSSLRSEARSTLAMLNDSTFDQFESTFIVRAAQPLQRFDCLLQVPIRWKSNDTSVIDHQPSDFTFSSRLFSVLREGLGDRVKLIDINLDGPPSWPVNSTPPAHNNEIALVCVQFDSANISRVIDHGPAAEEKKKSAKFQKFWGEKAELRRFKDGSILETLVWSPGSTYSIFREIVNFLISRHFSAEAASKLTFVGDGFEKLLSNHGTILKPFDTLKTAFNTLEKSIRDLDDLPLQLRQLAPISPQLRYSSIDSPNFSQYQPLRSPADVVIQFEGSGRWPDDLVAIQRTKIAFLLKIGSLLEESDDSITTRLGLENEEKRLRNCAFLDVIFHSGAVFRLRIQNDREQTLLERTVKDKTADSWNREEAALALSIFKTSYIQLPLHSQSISTHCTRFPLLSPTIRLVKLWFDRHMLTGHIRGEVLELLVAHVFLQPYPWTTPSSAMTGFLRTLFFISRWDWRLVPLIVDFTGSMTTEEVSSINTRLEAWRKVDPEMNRTVIVAASNHDLTGTAFTSKRPSKVAASRMTALARSACKHVKDQGLKLDHRTLFASSTSDYDFVLHISPKFTGPKSRKGSERQKFKNLEVQSEADTHSIDYQPVRLYVGELERLYTDSIVFFYSENTTSVVGGLWNPRVAAPRPFKVNLAYATKPLADQGGDEIVVDKSAILSEISRLGGDMITQIEVKRS